jgi:hypothetical protein
MSGIRQARQLELGARELLVIDDAREHVVTCESGELWITQDRDRRDIILPAGRSWRFECAGPVVLSALKPARATLAHTRPGHAASEPRRDGAASVLSLIRRWRFPALASFPATRIV